MAYLKNTNLPLGLHYQNPTAQNPWSYVAVDLALVTSVQNIY